MKAKQVVDQTSIEKDRIERAKFECVEREKRAHRMVAELECSLKKLNESVEVVERSSVPMSNSPHQNQQ